MKKLIIPVLLFFVMAVGCNRTKSNPNLVDIKLVVINDSVLVQNEYDEAYSRYTMNIDLPVTDNKILRQSIIHWMLSSETEDYATFFKEDKMRFFAEEGNEPRSVFEGNYSLSEQTDLYVTYISEGYVYTGGAHPLPWYWGASFSKTDGTMAGYDMFENPEQLVELVSENIRKQYFDLFNTEEEEYYFEPDTLFQLPTNQPWIETDSVVFCYGPFEIAPYAAGMPLCKISKDVLQPYLSKKGKQILNFE